jgi:hypothetical protein
LAIEPFTQVRRLDKVLKPGVMALLNTPNRKRLSRSLVEIFSGEREFPWWEHLREYTEEDFVYMKKVPDTLRRFANYWETHLFKPRG